MSAPPPPIGARPAERASRAWWKVDGSTLRADIGASLVVFLVALPLSLGIALASGAPVLAGLLVAIIGGVVAGLLGGSPLQVSGPAAGLTVVVAELITRFGWPATCAIVACAGVVQIGFGLSRLARFTQAIPPAVVHGMLAGIGGTIVLAQLHVVLGGKPRTNALDNILQLPAQALDARGPALAIGLCTIALVIGWPRLPGPLRRMPGPLVAIALATGLSLLLTNVSRVDLPGGLLGAISLPVLPEGEWSGMVGGVLTLALIASVESLLSAVAVDRMHDGPRSNPDRELIGQGAANTLSGLLGGLPITGVIVRSSINVRAGARTRAAAVLHAVWIAVFALLLVWVVESIPMAALAGLLVVIGVQLVKVPDIRAAHQHGDLLLYLATAAGVLALNLLEGVGIGMALAALLVLRRVVLARVRHHPPIGSEEHQVVVEGPATFLCVPALSRALAAIPAGAPTRVNLVTHYVDHAVREHLDSWVVRHRNGGAAVIVTQGAPSPGRKPSSPEGKHQSEPRRVGPLDSGTRTELNGRSGCRENARTAATGGTVGTGGATGSRGNRSIELPRRGAGQ